MPVSRKHLFLQAGSLIFSALALMPLTGCSLFESDNSTPPDVTALTAPPPAKAVTAAGETPSLSGAENFATEGDVTLGALLRHAALYSPEMIRQEHNIARNDAFRFRGWRQYMPFINANYQFGYFNLLKTDNTNNSGSSDRIGGSYSVSAQYPIFHWGAFSAEKDAALLREQRAQSSATIAWRNLSSALRRNYFEMVILKNEIEFSEKRLAWAQKRRKKAAANFEAGRADESSQIAHSLEIKRTELELERKKISLQAMLGKMRSDSGLESFEFKDIPGDILEPKVDLQILERQIEAFKITGADESTEVKIAQLYRDELEDEITRARARTLPTFNLGASVSQGPYQTNKGTFGLQTIFFTGITGSWHLFDRDIANTTIRSLKTQQRIIDADLKSSTTQRLTHLKNQIEEIRISQEMLALRLEYRSSIEKQLDAAKQQLALGRVDQSVVDSAEENLASIEQQILRDRTTIANAYYQFQSGIEQDPAVTLYTPPSNED